MGLKTINKGKDKKHVSVPTRIQAVQKVLQTNFTKWNFHWHVVKFAWKTGIYINMVGLNVRYERSPFN